DIVGKGGMRAVQCLLPRIVDVEAIDLVIANVENVAGGIGVTREAIGPLRELGVQIMTSGNHVWRKEGIEDLLEREALLLRPANYPPGTPGRGWVFWKSQLGVTVGIINLLGRVFMDPLECPFRVAKAFVDRCRENLVKVIVADFHAEATSEKAALAWYLDGQASAVVGSHTHVQTADERILPRGTGFISDMGMTGAQDSIIGVKTEASITRFLTGLPQKLVPSSKNPALHGVIVSVCEKTGKCLEIRRVKKSVERTELL
ncbi:MAG: YmdB family metallophosphoesterase, partial [Deltaproteobacteria bacterium]|nr:YmdB family metallophosphoesterase [Deltaproteobacteria bacterium]